MHSLPARRRTVLSSFAGGFVASLVPWALAAPADAEQAGFLALSALLVGRTMLDAHQAGRLFAALSADDAGFAAATRDLLAYVNDRKVDPLRLQSLLDEEKSPLARLPRTIASHGGSASSARATRRAAWPSRTRSMRDWWPTS